MKKYAKFLLLFIAIFVICFNCISIADVGNFESYDSDWGGSSSSWDSDWRKLKF